MPRGGRGGGRGGRGGIASSLAWTETDQVKADATPSELFPEYSVPTAAPLSKKEKKIVDHYLLVREMIHSGPLYTHPRAEATDATARAYGQEQINQRYGVHSRASVNPFLAMPSYAQRFERPKRSLPDFSARPFNRELFPAELHATLDGEDEDDHPRATKKRKVLELSGVTALKSAEDIFGQQAADNQKRALEQLERFEKSEKGQAQDVALDLVDDEHEYEEEYEEEYDDDEDGDYNAEGTFDNGEDDDDDHGDDDEPVADY